MSKIAHSALTVTFFTLGGIALSFLSNVVIAASFGAGADMDMFLAATTLPLFITTILSSSLNFTFIPVFAKYREKDIDGTWKLVSSFINLSALATAAVCLAGMVFAHPIMHAIVPGFGPEKLARSAELLRWLLPVIIFTAVNELMASVYYSNNRFVAPSLNKIISPAITVAYVFFFHASMSTKSIALAMLTASAVQTLILAYGFLRNPEFHYSPSLDFRNEGVKETLKLILPLVVGMLIYRTPPIFDRFFLSSLGEGSISHIGYASKLLGVVYTVVTSGISATIFPRMAHYASRGELGHLTGVMSKGIRMLIFLSMPFIIGLAMLGRPLVEITFQRGRFGPADTTAVCAALSIYMISLLTTSTGTVVSQGYYALRENLKISLMSSAMVPVYIAACALMIKPLGYLAIPAAFALDCSIQTTLGLVVLARKLPGLPRGLASYTAKTALAAAGACALFYPLLLSGWLWSRALAFPLALAGYLAVAVVFKVTEAGLIRQMLSDRFGRFLKIPAAPLA